MSETSTGDPQAIASMTGIENPSAREATTVARAWPYQPASSASVTWSRNWSRALPALAAAAIFPTRLRQRSG